MVLNTVGTLSKDYVDKVEVGKLWREVIKSQAGQRGRENHIRVQTVILVHVKLYKVRVICYFRRNRLDF